MPIAKVVPVIAFVLAIIDYAGLTFWFEGRVESLQRVLYGFVLNFVSQYHPPDGVLNVDPAIKKALRREEAFLEFYWLSGSVWFAFYWNDTHPNFGFVDSFALGGIVTIFALVAVYSIVFYGVVLPLGLTLHLMSKAPRGIVGTCALLMAFIGVYL